MDPSYGIERKEKEENFIVGGSGWTWRPEHKIEEAVMRSLNNTPSIKQAPPQVRKVKRLKRSKKQN